MFSMKLKDSLCTVLKAVLSKELNQPSGLLDVEHCLSLLRESDQLDQADELSTEEISCCAYPSSPLYTEIADRLATWIKTGTLPHRNLKTFYLLDEEPKETFLKLEEVWPSLKAFEISDSQYKTKVVTSFIEKLGVKGLLVLLGVRHTVGSTENFPPDKTVLIKSFNKKHNPNANLTVGARALSKHVHRDHSAGWWGELKGSEEEKNEQSLKVLFRILNDAAWINIHSIAGELKVLEVRCSEGYGARWTCDGKQFRGFLEPQMKDGHVLKWRH